MKKIILKCFLISLFICCCFFGIGKVHAETFGNFNPRAIGYWRGDGSDAYPSVESYYFEGDNWYGNYMSGNISKLNFEYVPTVLKHDEVYDYTFVVTYFTSDYSKFSATYSESYCDVSNPSSMQGSISNSTGIIHSGYSYRVVLNCRNIRYKQGVPVNLSLYFPVNTNSSGSQLIAVKSSVAVVERGSSNGDVVSGLDDLNETQKDTNKKLDEQNKKLDEANKNLKDTNDTLKDDDTSESSKEAENFFSGFTTNTHGLTSIVTAPLTLIANVTSYSCSPLPLDVPFLSKNKTLNLPCLSLYYKKYFGIYFDIYHVVTFGLISYWVCIRIFALVKEFKDPDKDSVEVMDL